MKSLAEIYSKPRKSPAWETLDDSSFVRLWTNDGDCWSFRFIDFVLYDAKTDSLLVNVAVGTMVIVGPKLKELNDDICSGKGLIVKADGQDITSITIILKQ